MSLDTRVRTGLGYEFSRARSVNVGLLSCKKRMRVPLRVRRGQRGRGGENERVEIVWYIWLRHRRLVPKGAAARASRKGKSRVHVCGRLRTPNTDQIYAQREGCALDHN